MMTWRMVRASGLERGMTAYLHYEKPKTAEMIVDEMLAIMSEIKAWCEKKAGEEANSQYIIETKIR